MGRGRGTWGGEGACERACHRVLHAHPACSRALGWVRVGGTCPGRRQDGAASCPPARLSTLPEKRVLATRFPQPPQAGRLRIFCVFRHTLNSRGLGSRGGCGCGDLPAQSHARRQVAGTRHPPVFGRCARALSCPDPPEHARCAAV